MNIRTTLPVRLELQLMKVSVFIDISFPSFDFFSSKKSRIEHVINEAWSECACAPHL